MGTRCGDIDPAIALYLQQQLGLSPSEVDSLLNKRSGLLGLAGSPDLRTVLQGAEQGDEDCVLTVDVRLGGMSCWLSLLQLLLLLVLIRFDGSISA